MKILYSDFRKLIPRLTATPKQISDFLTMAGFMLDGIEKKKYLGKADYLMSFEVRHNRGDCLSVLGLAYEVAAKYGLKVKLPDTKIERAGGTFLRSRKIKVSDGKYVKRVLAYEISGLKNQKSPAWLTEYLALHDMNSKNLLVDLSNYVMLITGYPSHLLDLEKISGQLHWDINKKYSSITTLDGTEMNLTKNKEIILRDNQKILALAGIVGGKNAELSLETTSIIAETAIYDPGTVRQNAANLRVFTEAGNRLSKYLDPSGLEYTMQLLLRLIQKYCGAEAMSIREYSYYPRKYSAPKIKFDPAKPSIYAGIEISRLECLKILKNLRFQIKSVGKNLIVTPPLNRLDVTLEEDVIEEVIRLYGFDKVPMAEIPRLEITDNITPPVMLLAEKIRDILPVLGYDETLTSPLTTKQSNLDTNYRNWGIVSTQNSVNEEYPDMRQAIAGGLINQLDIYLKKNLEFIKIFEIGKIFGEKEGKYLEYESLAFLNYAPSKKISFEQTKNGLEILLRYLGIDKIRYVKVRKLPKIANPYVAFDVWANSDNLGIIYKIKPSKTLGVSLVEINLEALVETLTTANPKSTVELLGKLVKLDVNITLGKTRSIEDTIKKAEEKIGRRCLWDVVVKDVFPEGDKVKYTLSVTYMRLSDQEAKELHCKTFNL